MVAPHAIIFIEFLQMVKIANYMLIQLSYCNNYNNNVMLHNINIIVHQGV